MAIRAPDGANKQSTTFHRCQREELEKNGSNQFVLDLYVNGSVERDKNVTKKSSGNKYRFLSITKILSVLVNSYFMLSYFWSLNFSHKSPLTFPCHNRMRGISILC